MAAIVGLDDSMLATAANTDFKTLTEAPLMDFTLSRARINGILEAQLGNVSGTLTGQDQNLPQAIASQVEQGGALANAITQLTAAQSNNTNALATALAAAINALASVQGAPVSKV